MLPRGRSTLRRFVFEARSSPRQLHSSPSPGPSPTSQPRTGPLPAQPVFTPHPLTHPHAHSHRPTPILTSRPSRETRDASLPTRLRTAKSPDDLSASVSSMAYSEMASSPAVDFLSAFAESTAPASRTSQNMPDEDPPGMVNEGDEVAGHVLGPIIGRGGFSIVRQATVLETCSKVAVKIVRHASPPDNTPSELANKGKGVDFSHVSCHTSNHLASSFRDRASSTPVPFDSYLVKSAHLPLPTSVTESLATALLKRELEIWSSLKAHPHLLPLLSIHRALHQTFIFMPLCDGGNLLQMLNAIKAQERPATNSHDDIHECPSRFLLHFSRGSCPKPSSIAQPSGLELSVILHIFQQIVLGLKYLHLEAGVTHKDIKLENILIHEGRIMIADFGLAVYPSSSYSQHHHNNNSNTRSSSTDSSLSRDLSLPKHFNTLPRIREGHKTGSSSLALSHSVRERSSRRRFGRGSAMPTRFASFSQLGIVRQHHQRGGENELSDGSVSSEDNVVLPTAAGSLAYIAPEQLRSDLPLSHPSLDIWALGCVLYGLLEGHLPFQDDFEPRLRLKIMNGQFKTPSFLLPSIIVKSKNNDGNDDDEEMKKKLGELLKGCLMVDKNDRWNIEQVVQKLFE